MVDHFRKRLSEDGLLRKLFNPGTYGKPESRIRILIDAGAQILEYDNRSLVKAWLKEDHEAVAAVYFDDDHRARVIYGKGTDIPLVASPFAENLEECLVYIDESHCRGKSHYFSYGASRRHHDPAHSPNVKKTLQLANECAISRYRFETPSQC
jgi:hypothetical protein